MRGNGETARCQVRPNSGREHAVPLTQGLFPERHDGQGATLGVFVPAPHVVDEEIEAAMIRADTAEE
jgi:hypothetical protein